MTDELKPCPFCRNAGNIKLVEYRPNCSGAVVCRQCGARGPKAKNDHKRGWKKKAIEGWNTRAERTCHIEFHSEMVSEGGMEGDTWWYCSSCGQELPGWAQDVSGVYDGLALLPGWEQSKGACLEKQVAEACGIPCKTVDEWIAVSK